MVKKFTVDCDFSGKKLPINLYIGNSAKGVHPLEFQCKWLTKEKGGIIPSDIMESFEKLRVISEKNRIPFEDICQYVVQEIIQRSSTSDIKKVNEITGSDGQKRSSDNISNIPNANSKSSISNDENQFISDKKESDNISDINLIEEKLKSASSFQNINTSEQNILPNSLSSRFLKKRTK